MHHRFPIRPTTQTHFGDRVWGSLDLYIPPLPPLTASPGTSRSRDCDVRFITASTPSSFIFKDVPDPRCPRSVLLLVTGLLASLGNRRELWKEPGCPAVVLVGTRRAASLMRPERVPRLVEISLCCSSSSRLDRMSPFFWISRIKIDIQKVLNLKPTYKGHSPLIKHIKGAIIDYHQRGWAVATKLATIFLN